MHALALVRTTIAVVTVAAAGQLVAVATGHARAPWSDAAVALDARVAAPAAWSDSASGHSPPSRARRSACPPEAPDAPAGRPAVSEDGVAQVLSLVVPATAILERDHKGRVVAATTNTGCPPRPTDELWVRTPGGSLEAAEPRALRGVHWYADPADAGRYVRHPPHP